MLPRKHMLLLITDCVAALLLNRLLQLAAIAVGVRTAFGAERQPAASLSGQVARLGILVTFLFFGHLLQIAVWAVLFRIVGAFGNFSTSFYHSTVNYSTLGYGDIVMAEPWRLAGALEASVGVMMFGVSTATLFAAVSRMFATRFSRGENQ